METAKFQPDWYQLIIQHLATDLTNYGDSLPGSIDKYVRNLRGHKIVFRTYSQNDKIPLHLMKWLETTLVEVGTKHGFMYPHPSRNPLIIVKLVDKGDFPEVIDTIFHESIHAYRLNILGHKKFPESQKTEEGMLEEVAARSGAIELSRILGGPGSEQIKKNLDFIEMVRGGLVEKSKLVEEDAFDASKKAGETAARHLAKASVFRSLRSYLIDFFQ